MGQTLENGIFLPDEGERNCYSGLAENWVALDTLVGAYSSHYQNTTIHVTASDKQTWNGKQDALSQTQLDAVNSGIDATKVQQIATNTSDISSLQSGKANDSDVLHKSGNESSSGNKIFEGEIISASNIVVSPDSTFVTSIKDKKLIDKNLFNILNERITYNNSRNIRYTWTISNKDSNGNTISSGVQLALSAAGQAYFYPINDNDIFFGASTAYIKGVFTKLINSLTPSSLSLPGDRSSRVDISSYLTNTASGDTNTYTAPSNGWIYLALNDVVVAHCFAQTAGNLSHYGQTFARASVGQLHCLFPIRKDDVFVSQWYTTTTVTVTNAYFIPCLGNI